MPLFSKCILLGDFEFGSDIACEIDCTITFVTYGNSGGGSNAVCETGGKDNKDEEGKREDKGPKNGETTEMDSTDSSTVNPQDFEVEEVATESARLLEKKERRY